MTRWESRSKEQRIYFKWDGNSRFRQAKVWCNENQDFE